MNIKLLFIYLFRHEYFVLYVHTYYNEMQSSLARFWTSIDPVQVIDRNLKFRSKGDNLQ